MAASEVDLANLLSAMPDPCVLLTADLVVLEANAAYLAATQFSRADLVDRPLLDGVPDRGDAATAAVRTVWADLAEVVRTGESRTSEVSRYDLPTTPGGRPQRRYWSPVNSPVLDARDEVRFIVIRVLDVTAAHDGMIQAVGQTINALGRRDGNGAALRHLSGYVSDAIRSAAQQPDLRDQLKSMVEMLDARMLIEQAKGVLMGRSGITAAAAFELLRIQSQHTNTKLRDVAASIVVPPRPPIVPLPAPNADAGRMPAPKRPSP